MPPNLIEILARSPRGPFALDLALKATLILAAAGLAAIILRRSSAAARHLAWCLGLGTALALPAFALALPGWSWRILPAAKIAGPTRPTADAPARRTAPASPAPDLLDEEMALEDDALIATAPAGPSSRPTSAGPIAPPAPSWRLLAPSWSWLWPAWLAGCLAVLSTPIAGRIALRTWARHADRITGDDWTALLADLSARLDLKRRVTLLRGGRDAMPMTWGWLRAVVLLPAEADDWDLDRRRDVLLHELAHVKRLDGPTQTMARLACALYWFHPLAWYAARRMRVERERACDDVVLLAGARPSDYAGHLLEIARGLRAPRAANLAALAMARPSQLEGRLLAILDPARRRRGPGRRLAAIGLLAAILLLVPLSMLRIGARAAAPPAPLADNPPPADPAARMTITGRVLDPSGKPVPGAAVMVLLTPKYPTDRPSIDFPNTLPTTAEEGRCDGSGGFRIERPRTSSARHAELLVAALAPGFGVGWTGLDPDADSPAVDVPLQPEQVIRGRLFDANGQPAPRVALRIRSLGRVGREGISGIIVRPDLAGPDWRDPPAWPGPATSDDEGRFTLRGVGGGLYFPIVVDDPRYSLPPTTMATGVADGVAGFAFPASAIRIDPGPDPKPIAIALQPARTVTGRVTYADTGRPVPHTLIKGYGRNHQADAEGRFRIAAEGPGRIPRYAVLAQAPEAAPYLPTRKLGEWPRGAVEQSADIALPRGVVIRGKITDEGTGRPVAGAIVRLVVSWASANRLDDGTAMATGPDGTYRIAGPPGPGFVVVQGPSDDYILREFGGDGGPNRAQPGRSRYFAHDYRAVELKPGADQEIDLSVRPGTAIPVRLVDPDGRPTRDARVFSRLLAGGMEVGGWKSLWLVSRNGWTQVRDGRVVLHGLEPGAEVSAFFLDAGRKLGAAARISSNAGASGPLTVRLEPCGSARARLVDPDGKPLARYPAWNLAALLLTPGPPRSVRVAKEGPLFADEAGVEQIDRVNYGNTFETDAEGRVTFPALVPGAPYRIVDRSGLPGGDAAIRKEFTVKPGEPLDLGDILIARPRARN